MNDRYNISFRCFFDGDDGVHFTTHYCPDFLVSDIPRWIDSYKFTHQNCTSISVKVWFTQIECNEQEDDNNGRTQI